MVQEHLSGIIDRFLFQNEETGYIVFILQNKQREPITIVGSFVNIHIGQEIHLVGTWNFHQKFGKQFVVSSYTIALPTTIVGIKKYLSSGFIKGIGKVYADKIVQHFKEKTLEIIDENPDRLSEVDGIGLKRLGMIKESWIDQKYIAKIMVFLQEKGVSSAFATKIYKRYGNDAIALLTQNPYRLTDDIWGIGFATADKIAQNMGFAKGSKERFQAGILFTLHNEAQQGHVYQEVEVLKQKTFQILEVDPELHSSVMKEALTHLYHKDAIKIISYEAQHFIGLTSFYYTEYGIAKKLQQIIAQPIKNKVDAAELYKLLQKVMSVELHEQQQKGILVSFDQKVSIVTGGPGTGKTTLIKGLLSLLDHYKIEYVLAAPTGRAAKRMMESTKRHAVTLHRLLEFDPSVMRFQKNEQNALSAQFIIVDEASMIDIFLMNALVKAISLNAHIIFIGDIDQLPSVGAGNVLHDLIESGSIPYTKLEYIFRQAQNSMIIQNAHRINQGIFPSNSLEDSKKDFYFFTEEHPEACFEHIKKSIMHIVQKHGISSDNCIVLTPMNRGAVGTQKLNHDMQQLLNPESKPSYSFSGTLFKEGDRVMQIKNNYDKKIFNGDIGTILEIDLDEKGMIIDFDGSCVEYFFDELHELVLAYAITIHKSQGSEYDAVIVPIFTQHFMLLQRNLLYTAITRAKKLCIFIGQPKALAMGIHNNKQEKRITFLDKLLTNSVSCR